MTIKNKALIPIDDCSECPHCWFESYKSEDEEYARYHYDCKILKREVFPLNLNSDAIPDDCPFIIF